MSGPVLGTVYLLHFANAELQPAAFGHARHYTGWTLDLPARLAEHDAGRGARLTEVAREAGLILILILSRTWPGVSRAFERSLKNRGGAARYCPACGVRPKPWPQSAHWTAVLRNGCVVNLEAECRRCHERKPIFAFLGNTRRRICTQCSDPPATARLVRAA